MLLSICILSGTPFNLFHSPRGRSPLLRSSDRRPNLAKESELPQESYKSRKIVGRFRHFSSFFLHGSHAYILLFNTSIASVGTDERIAKIRVSKCPILKFVWDFEKCQNGPKVNVKHVSFPLLLTQQFPRFLNAF